MPRQGAAASAQEPETVIEAVADFLDREQRDPCGCQLNRQGDAVEPPADLGDEWCIRLIEYEDGHNEAGTIDEDSSALAVAYRVELRALRQVERSHRIDLLSRDAERLAAGGDDADARAEQHIDDVDDGVDEVLAVVDDEEHLPRGDVSLEPRSHRFTFGVAHAKGGGDDQGDARAFLDRREIDEPDTVGEGMNRVREVGRLVCCATDLGVACESPDGASGKAVKR